MNLNKGFYQTEKKQTSPLIDDLPCAQSVVFRAASQSIKPSPPIDYIQWAENNIVFDADNRFPGPYDPDRFPFFKKILRSLQLDHSCSIVVLMGSAQVGKTLTAEVFVGANLDLSPLKLFYVLPTLDMATNFVREKWKPFVEGCRPLKRVFPRENRSRSTTNTALYKERIDGRGSLRIAGANSASSLTQASYRLQVHDDLGKWENNEHGDPEDQADKRSQSWGNWRKILKISTPGLLGRCRITKAYARSNKQKYHVPCPLCRHEHALEWENFKKSLYEGMDYSEAHFTCPDCGGVIEHHHKEWMLAEANKKGDAAWIAENPEIRGIEGYYIWVAYSPLQDWTYIAEEYFKALGDPEKEQTFMTDVVGLAYEQKGEAPPWKEIRDRAAGSCYTAGTIPVGALLLTLGMDVQGDRVEWLLKGWGPDLRRYTIQHGVIDGHITEDRATAALDLLIKRKWRNVFGREMTVDLAAIDANYETNAVKDWAKRHAKVITVKGAKAYTAAPMIPVKEERNNKGKIRRRQTKHWLVGVSGLKAALYKQLEKVDPLARGYCGFPSDLDDEYYRQLASERRILETNKKTQYSEMRWVKLPQVRNEILDMELYAEAAARRLGWHNASESEWERVRAERESLPQDGQQLDLLDPSIAAQAAKPPPPKNMRTNGRRVRHPGIKG